MPNAPIAAPSGNPPVNLPGDVKAWYTSKVLWVNILGGITLILGHFGFSPVDGTTAAAVLAVVNFVLRLITKQPIEW